MQISATLQRTRIGVSVAGILILITSFVAGCGSAEQSSPEATSTSAAAQSTPSFTCRGDGERTDEAVDSNTDTDTDAPSPVSTIDSGLYGDPEAATRYWQAQTESDCGLMATRMLIGEVTGNPPTEREIIDLAVGTDSICSPGEPVYDESIDPADGEVGHGTCSVDLLLLLDHFGIDADYTDDGEAADGEGPDTGLDALATYLGNGQKAMVCVNSRIIWDVDGDRTNCGHMIAVAAIDFDNDIVYLGDSGGEVTRDEQVSIDTFESAWATGDHQLVVTAPR